MAPKKQKTGRKPAPARILTLPQELLHIISNQHYRVAAVLNATCKWTRSHIVQHPFVIMMFSALQALDGHMSSLPSVHKQWRIMIQNADLELMVECVAQSYTVMLKHCSGGACVLLYSSAEQHSLEHASAAFMSAHINKEITSSIDKKRHTLDTHNQVIKYLFAFEEGDDKQFIKQPVLKWQGCLYHPYPIKDTGDKHLTINVVMNEDLITLFHACNYSPGRRRPVTDPFSNKARGHVQHILLEQKLNGHDVEYVSRGVWRVNG